ncbi:MAG: phosphate signaling complex protein PhoU [Planctomycetota bacterium]
MKHLQHDLEKLQRQLLNMSGQVEEMIDQATRALAERREEWAEQVVAADAEVDQQEVHIEEECLKILALHQPVAVDLRRIATVLKANGDLERIADLAVSIAERAQAIADSPEFPIPEQLTPMVALATQMVRGSMDAFVNLDAAAARRILKLDEHVDQHNRDIIAELQLLMQQEPLLVSPALHCFSATRHIERIADHATNIAEDVIYLVEGDIIRHSRRGRNDRK